MKPFSSFFTLFSFLFLVAGSGCNSETEPGLQDERAIAIAGYELEPRVMSHIDKSIMSGRG